MVPNIQNTSDLYSNFSSPDKFDDNDPDLMLNTPVSKYFSTSELNDALDKANPSSLTSVHCNIRSLPKNLTLIHDLLDSLHKFPDIIAITETKLNSETITNIDINNYNFFHVDSPTQAGGAGLYINNNLKVSPRPDIKFVLSQVESCWAEIDCGIPNKPNILVGCIYRHPSEDLSLFTSEFESIISNISQENMPIHLMGDFNIDLIKYGQHKLTEEYLDMIFSYNLLPIITKPTRITHHTSTLIDHIYVNSTPDNITAGIIVTDISDHLPVFCITDFEIKKQNKHFYIRDYKHFVKDEYLKDISHGMISFIQIITLMRKLRN